MHFGQHAMHPVGDVDAIGPGGSGHSSTRHLTDGLIDFAGGVNAGITCVYVGQPLDTVKVKMQTFSHLYKNSFQCFMATFRTDGIRGLYAGSVPALAANIAENAVLFCGYGVCQKAVARLVGKTHTRDLNPVENALAGSGGALFASFALCPTELIKCKLQAMRETQAQAARQNTGGVQLNTRLIGPWALTRQIVREQGMRGMFQGLTPTLAREVPGYFCFFGAYEACRYAMTAQGQSKDELSALHTILAGGVGGVTLWTLMFPFDVVKSRMQVTGKGSLVGLLVHIVRHEGVRALYCGLAPTLIRTFFASGALFVAYEYTTKTLHAAID